MSFNQRLTIACYYEDQVLNALRHQGWHAEAFGQALLTEPMRKHLRMHDTAARWLPDIIAAKDGVLVYVDAKASTAIHTGNHAVEDASTEALVRWQDFQGARVLYAFPHDSGHSLVPLGLWNEHKRPAPFAGKGSGTPFSVAPCQDICEFVMAVA